jgi:NAD(P)H-dependent FMN reductase
MSTTTGSDPMRLAVIVGSTRKGRATDRFLPWLVERAERHGAFSVEVLDLRDWDLPMFQETMATISSGYSTASVRRWNEEVGAADAYLFVTPEYNHSVPGVLKNAIDNVVASHGFRNKPAGFVGYSGGIIGGARAVEHLAAIAIEAELAPLRNAVLLAQVGKAFDADGRPVDPVTDFALSVLLDDLAWWGDALRQARRAGELPPANRRRATPPAA